MVKQEEHETISLQALFICHCVYVLACALLSPLLLMSNKNPKVLRLNDVGNDLP
jgi:hypothetical protein